MKLILNDSTLEITTREKENRHKTEVHAGINSSGKWAVNDPYYAGYFVDAKVGDVITITPNTTKNAISAAFTSSNVPENGESVPFANGTSSRLTEVNNMTVNENCYLFVLTKNGDNDYTPASVVINGLTLDENGYL